MGRPKLSPRRLVSVRMPEVLHAEMVLLKPELQDHQGYTKHGAISNYINSLVRQDLDNLKSRLRAATMPGSLDKELFHDRTS